MEKKEVVFVKQKVHFPNVDIKAATFMDHVLCSATADLPGAKGSLRSSTVEPKRKPNAQSATATTTPHPTLPTPLSSPSSTAKMPKEVSDIKQFIEICRRKDASCKPPFPSPISLSTMHS